MWRARRECIGRPWLSSVLIANVWRELNQPVISLKSQSGFWICTSLCFHVRQGLLVPVVVHAYYFLIILWWFLILVLENPSKKAQSILWVAKHVAHTPFDSMCEPNTLECTRKYHLCPVSELYISRSYERLKMSLYSFKQQLRVYLNPHKRERLFSVYVSSSLSFRLFWFFQLWKSPRYFCHLVDQLICAKTQKVFVYICSHWIWSKIRFC